MRHSTAAAIGGRSPKRRRKMATDALGAVGKRKRDLIELVHSEALHSITRRTGSFCSAAVRSEANLVRCVPVERLLGGFLCTECNRRGPQHDACGAWHMPSCSWTRV